MNESIIILILVAALMFIVIGGLSMIADFYTLKKRIWNNLDRRQCSQDFEETESEKNGDFVFYNEKGKPISPNSVNNMFGRVLKRARLPKIRFHDLRHTFVTLVLQNGVEVKTLSGMLGNFSVGFTLIHILM